MAGRRKKRRNRLAGNFIGACLGTGVFFMAITGTGAWMTDHDRILNQMTAGYNDSTIEEEFPSPTPAEPGETVAKEVKIRNSGPVPCYIRVSVLISEGEVTLEGLDTTNWLYEEDGFYYYKKAVEPGESTDSLFTGVKTDAASGNSQLTVTVVEESVQAVSGGIPYKDYQEAWKNYRGGAEN